MYLKSIELVGFKSFADKTKLTFEPGITSVVGPNGSGKSNISDAIRWVMGEMSAKALRGGAMQDVIFAGTQKRKPLGYAQVSLTLDNANRGLNIDYSEVTITRRVYRSGESEYKINSSACRLKDIHELLMDTGLGRDGYSIIGQGKVNEIISGKSDERRNIFDEAAGISKFRHRKAEAQRKLESTSENLVRITDIVTELVSRLEPLKKQSEKAKRYLSLYEEYKVIDINMFLSFADKYKQTKDQLVKDFEIVCQNLAEHEKAVEEIVGSQNMLNKKAEEITLKLDEMRENSGKTELLAKSISGEIDVLLNTVESGEKMIERIKGEIGQLKEKIAAGAEKQKENANQKDQKSQSLKTLQSELEKISESARALNEKLIEMSGNVNKKKNDIVELLNEAADSKSRLSSLEAFKKSFIDRKEALSAERNDAAAEIKKLTDKKSEIKKLLCENEIQTKKHNEEVENVKREEADKTKKAEQLNDSIMHSKGEYNRLNSRLMMLLEMERDYEGLAKSTKTVLNGAKNGQLTGCRICGILSSVIDVEKKYVTAIEAALGGALGNIITEDEFDAKKAIEFLKRTGGGRATFLPISSVKGREIDNIGEIAKTNGFVALASDAAQTDEKYKGIIRSLLGRTVIAKDMDSAVHLSRKFSYRFKVVTLEGEILNAGGSITGGSVNKTTGLLSRANEIKELTKKTKQQKSDIDENEKQYGVLISQTGKLREKLKELENKGAQLRQKNVVLKSDFSHIDILIDSAKESDGGAAAEYETIEKQIKSANEEIAVLINETTAQEFKADALKKEIGEFDEKVSEISKQREKINEKVRLKTLEISDKKHEIASLDEEKCRLIQSLEEYEKSICDKKDDIEGIIKENEKRKTEINEKREAAKGASEKAKTLLLEAENLEKQRDETKELVLKASTRERETREKLYLLKEEQNRLDLKKEKLDEDMDAASAKMWDSYEVTYNTAAQYRREDFSQSEAKKRSAELKSQIKQLGNINLDAVEEYEEIFKRHEFLSSQAKDLESAKTQLEKLIEQITLQMKEQFSEQFAIINEKFTQTFSLLFGGGRASLYLSDPNNVLESGIEIEAQPPGKSLKNLSLLSGGEMAFTAIALLFAILKVRPTPFCVLDEIEAALDEPNVYRFADYLKVYCRNTQFILVTHRRGTMEAANLLYGVTMQEKGVSKLLSLKIDEIENFEN